MPRMERSICIYSPSFWLHSYDSSSWFSGISNVHCKSTMPFLPCYTCDCTNVQHESEEECADLKKSEEAVEDNAVSFNHTIFNMRICSPTFDSFACCNWRIACQPFRSWRRMYLLPSWQFRTLHRYVRERKISVSAARAVEVTSSGPGRLEPFPRHWRRTDILLKHIGKTFVSAYTWFCYDWVVFFHV